jgi:5-methylcytosine-specific restriction endonuclease McrA
MVGLGRPRSDRRRGDRQVLVERLEQFHVIPWSRGGATSVGNLQLLCRRCNLAKGARV